MSLCQYITKIELQKVFVYYVRVYNLHRILFQQAVFLHYLVLCQKP